MLQVHRPFAQSHACCGREVRGAQWLLGNVLRYEGSLEVKKTTVF